MNVNKRASRQKWSFHGIKFLSFEPGLEVGQDLDVTVNFMGLSYLGDKKMGIAQDFRWLRWCLTSEAPGPDDGNQIHDSFADARQRHTESPGHRIEASHVRAHTDHEDQDYWS